jgi:hypothetical protein
MALTNPSTMSSANLAADVTFLARVKAELLLQCQNIATEAITTAGLMLHVRRAQMVSNILQAIATGTVNWPAVFAVGVATDATVLSDATSGSTVDVTSGNSATQQALVTDTHMGNAIAAQFNAFLQPI